jgi:hypothetical protein
MKVSVFKYIRRTGSLLKKIYEGESNEDHETFYQLIYWRYDLYGFVILQQNAENTTHAFVIHDEDFLCPQLHAVVS